MHEQHCGGGSVQQDSFHKEAWAEMVEAAQWLEDQTPGLGDDLLAAIEGAAIRLAAQPGIGQIVRLPGIALGHRRLVLRRFSYIVVYRMIGRRIWIVAIAHTSRKPGYWSGR